MSDLTELFTWTCAKFAPFKWFSFNLQCSSMFPLELVVLNPNAPLCGNRDLKLLNLWLIFRTVYRSCSWHGNVNDKQDLNIQNWTEDLFWKQLDLNYPGMPDAMVHHGFYTAYHNTTIRPGIVYAVKKAKEFYGDLDIMVTGHSMGGAMASFCALDLTVWLHKLGLGSLVYRVEKVCDGSGEDPD
ncbi:hypothetical protein REPUB_Repub15cG0025400 [Reevesia pubescens]